MRPRRSILIGVVAAVLLVTSGIAASSAAAAPVAPRAASIPYGMEPNLIFKHSNKCLDVPHSSTSVGVTLIQYTCNGQSNQHWRFETVPDSEGLVHIVNEHSHLCMGITGPDNNDHVVQGQCGGATYANVFYFDYVGSHPEPYYEIVSFDSGKAINVYKASKGNNATVREFTPGDGYTNEWLR